MSGPLDAHDLVALAHEARRNDPAPNARFTAALIARALEIAAREALEYGDADRDVARARAAIADFAGDAALVAAIRSGALDAPSVERSAAVAYAAALVRRRLAVTNPARL